METYTAEQIANEAFNILLSYQQDESEVYYSGHDQYSFLTISFLEEVPDTKRVTLPIAYELIRKAVQRSLNRQGIVFLYTCPDNTLISLDRADRDEDLSPFDKQADNFYIGRD